MIHEAGALLDGVQRCRRCDLILTDYRGAMTIDVGPAFQGFEVGASIRITEYAGGQFVGVTSEAPDCRRPGGWISET